MINGSYVPEGSFIELSDDEVPQTTVVVFIVEAKLCNENLSVKKNMVSAVAAMEKAFTELGLLNVRWVKCNNNDCIVIVI